jgi:excisionase family DNA binding protein
MDPKKFQTFTPGQFCHAFQLQPDQFLRLVADGTIPAYKLGPHVRIPVDSTIRAMRPVGKAKVGNE